MMTTKYGTKIKEQTFDKELSFLTNQIYKLLPLREEKQDWRKTLKSVIFEVNSIYNLITDMQDTLFPLLFKLEGINNLSDDDKDFMLFRKTIFECLSIIGEVKLQCQDMKIYKQD